MRLGIFARLQVRELAANLPHDATTNAPANRIFRILYCWYSALSPRTAEFRAPGAQGVFCSTTQTPKLSSSSA
jgi:hypothetical protein